MKPGSFLKSGNGEYVLVFNRKCNLGVKDSDGDITWITDLDRNNDCYLCVQNDGNVVIYTNDGHEALWATGSNQEDMCDNGVRLIMQDDGNLVVYNREKEPLWASQ